MKLSEVGFWAFSSSLPAWPQRARAGARMHAGLRSGGRRWGPGPVAGWQVDASLEERAGWMWGQADGLGTVNHLMQMGFI